MKTAIVTGTSKKFGVGRQTVLDLSSNGYNVIATSTDISKIKDLESENIKIEKLDLTNFNEIKEFYNKYKDITLDLLVNNAAGGIDPTYLIDEDPSNFTQSYTLNVSGPMYLTQLFLNNLKKSDNSTVIFISSFAGRYPYLGQSNYCNSKRGVSGLAELFRLEYSMHNIKVTDICPASINTEPNVEKPAAISATDVSSAILWVTTLPQNCNINQIELAPTQSKIFN